MFDQSELRELRDGVRQFAGEFDPALLDGAGARRVVEDAAAIEKMAASVKAAAATRLAETGQWRREGERSPAHQLARLAGTGVGQAAQALETAKRMEHLPALAAATKAGELSPQQAAAVADAATADPTAEERLVRKAKRARCRSSKTSVVGPRQRPTMTQRLAGDASTPVGTCVNASTPRVLGTSRCETTPKSARG